jgi:hypothetical protein
MKMRPITLEFCRAAVFAKEKRDQDKDTYDGD